MVLSPTSVHVAGMHNDSLGFILHLVCIWAVDQSKCVYDALVIHHVLFPYELGFQGSVVTALCNLGLRTQLKQRQSTVVQPRSELITIRRLPPAPLVNSKCPLYRSSVSRSQLSPSPFSLDHVLLTPSFGIVLFVLPL